MHMREAAQSVSVGLRVRRALVQNPLFFLGAGQNIMRYAHYLMGASKRQDTNRKHRQCTITRSTFQWGDIC